MTFIEPETPRGGSDELEKAPSGPHSGQVNTRDRALVWLLPVCSLMSAQRLQDPDIWWHLENGRLMLSQGTFLPVDDRSFTMDPGVRVNPSWLWDLLTALTAQAVGTDVLLLLPILITFTILVLGLLATPIASRPAMALAGLMLVPVLASRAFPRPDTLAPLLMLGMFMVLQRDMSRPRNAFLGFT